MVGLDDLKDIFQPDSMILCIQSPSFYKLNLKLLIQKPQKSTLFQGWEKINS